LANTTRILILGATGHFGGRICRRLLGEPNTDLIVSGRNHSTAETFATALRHSVPESNVIAAALDQSAPQFAADLAALRPDIVVHTAGPYQGQDYRVAEACMKLGCHYIDLADGREFVAGFDQLHDGAIANDVLLVSGASTLPGLSTAVLASVRDQFARIDSVAISIAPAHQTPRGTGTVAAVLSYCGRPFEVLEHGRWATTYGWQDLRRQSYPGFGNRWSGACDVPDLALIPQLLPGVRSVTFHAALEARWEQLALWLMAGLVRIRLVRSWGRGVQLFRWLSDRLIGFGSATGGMQMVVSGADESGGNLQVSWDLTAQQNHGPEIPCIPAAILVRKLCRDELPLRGAYPCVNMITLSEFAAEVADLDISWTVNKVPDDIVSLD
jgi:short subunit dehydrogenase-like uncharacterized protein